MPYSNMFIQIKSQHALMRSSFVLQNVRVSELQAVYNCNMKLIILPFMRKKIAQYFTLLAFIEVFPPIDVLIKFRQPTH